MARVLYSCCGEGQGHSSRVFTIATALMRLGHEVRILASHKAFEVLRPRLPDVREIPGFTFVYRNNRVDLLASFRRNLPLLQQRARVIRRIRDLIEDWQPHLAITDFEPFLPRAAHAAGLRCISLDHQGVISYARPELPPDQWISAAAARTVARFTGYRETARIATSFFYPPVPPGENIRFFPPILRDQVLSLSPRDEGYVVVYQTSTSFSRLPELLKRLPFQFKVFAFEREGADGNIRYFQRSDTRFIEEVGGASWLLINGGYTTMSEALYLGKPVFSMPVDWQFEQWLNARYLHDLGYGMMCEYPRHFDRQMPKFLARLDHYRQNIARQNFLGNPACPGARAGIHARQPEGQRRERGGFGEIQTSTGALAFRLEPPTRLAPGCRALIRNAFDEHDDGAVFIVLHDGRFAERDDESGLQTHAHLRVGRHAVWPAAGDIGHGAPQKHLEAALVVIEGRDRAVELESHGHLVVVYLHGIFLQAVQLDLAFGGEHFQGIGVAFGVFPFDADEIIDRLLGGDR